MSPKATDEGKIMATEVRKARWLGIVLVLVIGGAVAAYVGSLPDSGIGQVIAYAVIAFIVLLVIARFLPDSAFGGRVGRARARSGGK